MGASAFELSRDVQQCLVGVGADWGSSQATLRYYERGKDGKWVQVWDAWPARLGKQGMAWGLGMHSAPKGVVMKQEGDWKSPVGVFAIGGVWGYEKSIRKDRKLPYRQITPRDLWVEDPESKHYNRHVVLDQDPATVWEKKQQMKQDDPAHALKLFIAHNAPPKVVKGAGSSIFFHIWRDAGGRPTAGCTTMDEQRLRSLIARIDPAKRPVYVLLPKEEYEKRRMAWRLP